VYLLGRFIRSQDWMDSLVFLVVEIGYEHALEYRDSD
jgi:hypothetical protein